MAALHATCQTWTIFLLNFIMTQPQHGLTADAGGEAGIAVRYKCASFPPVNNERFVANTLKEN